MVTRAHVTAAVTLALTVTTVSAGQGSRAQQVSAPAKRMNATKITEAPTIDGVLDDGVWQTATPIADFVQAEPAEGLAATERTEVRLVYDDDDPLYRRHAASTPTRPRS